MIEKFSHRRHPEERQRRGIALQPRQFQSLAEVGKREQLDAEGAEEN
jgi:hypothetical protein